MIFTKEELANWKLVLKALREDNEWLAAKLAEENLEAADKEAEEMEGRRDAE